MGSLRASKLGEGRSMMPSVITDTHNPCAAARQQIPVL
jgi:hypothetical protein